MFLSRASLSKDCRCYLPATLCVRSAVFVRNRRDQSKSRLIIEDCVQKYPHWWVYPPIEVGPAGCSDVGTASAFFQAWGHHNAHGQQCTCWIARGRSRFRLEQQRLLEQRLINDQQQEREPTKGTLPLHNIETSSRIDELIWAGLEECSIPTNPTTDSAQLNPYVGDDTMRREAEACANGRRAPLESAEVD